MREIRGNRESTLCEIVDCSLIKGRPAKVRTILCNPVPPGSSLIVLARRTVGAV